MNGAPTSLVLVLLAFSLSAAPGCKKDEKKSEAPAASASSASEELSSTKPALAFKPSAEQLQLAQKLAASVDDSTLRFRGEGSSDAANAKLYTYLAATSEETKVVAAGLRAMAEHYATAGQGKEKPDNDFTKTVIYNLQAEDSRVQGRALAASRVVVGQAGGDAVLDAVLALADTEKFGAGVERYELIQTLASYGKTKQDDKVIGVLIRSLDSAESYNVATALQILIRNHRRLPNRADVAKKAIELLTHPEPAVRGRAVELLGLLGRTSDDAKTRLVAALSDEAPYVRSEAARALGRVRHKPAIHELIKLVDDDAEDQLTLSGWVTLEGLNGRMATRTSAWNSVRESAINAIANLSAGELRLTPASPKDPEGDLKKNAAAAKAWYAKNKNTLPKLGEPTPAQAKDEPKPGKEASPPKTTPASATAPGAP